MKNEKETDPDGLPLDRKLSKQADEIMPTSTGITPTSPTPLTGKPSGLKVDDVDDPGATNAPKIAMEAPKAARGNSIPEHRGADLSQLPETIDASRDFSNPDGCAEGGWWQR